MSDEGIPESAPAAAPVRLEDLSSEDFNRLFGKVFGKIKQAAGLDAGAPDAELYKALQGAAALRQESAGLRSQVAASERALEDSRTAAARLYGIVLERLPEGLRQQAPAAEQSGASELAQWAQMASALAQQSRAPSPVKQVDAVRGGQAPPASDAETWVRLLSDSQNARSFKKAHPEEWRRLVNRFGGKSLTQVKKLIGR